MIFPQSLSRDCLAEAPFSLSLGHLLTDKLNEVKGSPLWPLVQP